MLVGGEIASKTANLRPDVLRSNDPPLPATANLRFLRAPASDLKVRLARQPLTKEDTMSRSHHIAKITSGAAIEHVRSYLLSEAARLGLGEEVDAADCRKLLALLQDMRRSLETIERRGGLVVVSSRPSSRPTAAKATAHSESPTDAVPIFPCQRGASSRSGASCTPTAPWPRLPCASGKTRPGKGKFAKFRLRPMRLHNEHASRRKGSAFCGGQQILPTREKSHDHAEPQHDHHRTQAR